MSRRTLMIELDDGHYRFEVSPGQKLLLGRAKSCELTLYHPGISRKQLLFDYRKQDTCRVKEVGGTQNYFESQPIRCDGWLTIPEQGGRIAVGPLGGTVRYADLTPLQILRQRYAHVSIALGYFLADLAESDEESLLHLQQKLTADEVFATELSVNLSELLADARIDLLDFIHDIRGAEFHETQSEAAQWLSWLRDRCFSSRQEKDHHQP